MASGAGSTNWEAYGLEQLWQMVRDEDKAATISMDQHAAFGLMHDVLEHEVEVLTRAVEQLEAKWPPRPGTAAEAFTSFVRNWIASMAETAEGAAATQQVIGDITTELTWARSRVAELMAANRRLTEAEEANPFAAEACAQSREALTREARRILAEADFAVAAAADRLPKFPMLGLREEPVTPIDLDDGSNEPGPGWVGSTPVPYIEPPVNRPPRLAEPGSVSNPGVPATEPTSAPVLEGSRAPALTDPGGGPISSPPVGPDGGIWASTGQGPGVAGPRGAAGGSGTPAAPASPAGSAGVAARAGTAGGMMPVPPVMPPSGARTGMPGPGVVPGGRAARPGVRRKKKDPRDPWYVPEGVPPVLEPASPPRFDPGPGVIGIDR